MILPLWAWIIFYVLVLIMLIIDLKMFGKKGQHEVNVKEALQMTAVWIAVSLLFCVGIYFFYPVASHEKAMEFLAGYLIEKSLSMDNLFVFLMLFTFFGIERKYQHEVLFWGIFGALVLRSIFIFAGAAMVEQFEWILGLFGLFLVYSGGKMFGHDDEQLTDPSKNIFVKWFKKFFPVTDKMHGDKFFIREEKPETRNQKPETNLSTLNSSLLTKKATPLFVALIVIETTDVAFVGLRAMYFALAAVAKYFKYLKYGLGFILIFVGIKMLLAMDEYINALLHLIGIRYTMPHIEVSTPFSLSVIFGLLTLSILLSLAVKRKG